MSIASHHAEWLSLIETSGPFLSMPVLLRAFSNGLEKYEREQIARLRESYADWLERGSRDVAAHRAWVLQVLTELLEYPADFLLEGQAIPPGLEAAEPQFGETLRPDWVLQRKDSESRAQLLISLYPPSQKLDGPVAGKIWKATPGTRMMELLHATEVPLGLVTNGEHWMLVYAPRGETTGFASWYADLWMQEPITLRAFFTLLHLRRFFGVAQDDTLSALYAASAKDQQEVTEQLGYQVRQAVEILVQALDSIDAESGRQLLAGVSEKNIYDSALTVMMRLVFLFSAEERGLLLLGDALYDQHYAVSTLSALLREVADQHGEEILERRNDAWCRLLATFRAVYGGVQHEAMRLPAYGGTLFDPDRYSFLEGRTTDSTWRSAAAAPLKINNRVVLHLLEALQILRVRVPGGGPAEARRLSFRALDVEQIGHVYEGLLDHTAKRAGEVVLGLVGTRDQEPEIPLSNLEAEYARGIDAFVEFLAEETGRQASTIQRALETKTVETPLALGLKSTENKRGKGRTRNRGAVPVVDEHKLLIACGQDPRLVDKVKPFAALLRENSFGQLVVIPGGSVYVTRGSDRRSTATHYTPRSLTEPIVQYTLEPLVYIGPAEGKPKEEWQLKSAKEILDLKICDMTMGSGAFLVQGCRYLSERLVEAWETAEKANPTKILATPEGDFSEGDPRERLIPFDPAERLAIARRYVADRCLYGVDINPMAVEMAKLSLWLITLQKDRPFTFLNHALKWGDSLLGVTSLKQIENFSLRSGQQQMTFATSNLFRYIEDAAAKRRALEALPSNNYSQIEVKNRLHAEAEAATAKVKALADCIISMELGGSEGNGYNEQRTAAADRTEIAMRESVASFQAYAQAMLKGKQTFHWPVEFPEVFARGAFDAFIGNPPFMHGSWISSAFGEQYATFLRQVISDAVGKIDLVVYFLRRAAALTTEGKTLGLVVTSKIKEGAARVASYDWLLRRGWSFSFALSDLPWPGSAGVIVSCISMFRGNWAGLRTLNDVSVQNIDSRLEANEEELSIKPLAENVGTLYLGAKPDSLGFVLTSAKAQTILTEHPKYKRVIRPYFSGTDLNDDPLLRPPRYIIDFSGMSLEQAAAYPELLQIVEQDVKPSRMKLKREAYRDRWWQFTEPQLVLFQTIRHFPEVLALCRVSKHFAVRFVPTGAVYSDTIVIFVRYSMAEFAVLSSSTHYAWAVQFGGTHGSGTPEYKSYKPATCGVSYPFPLYMNEVESAGTHYHNGRQEIMVSRGEGLTDTYNRFHDPREKSEDVARLRVLHVGMDQAVSAAYGWSDLDLGHGFQETKQGVRYTISEAARRIVLDRLLALNHQRYDEEVKAGLHQKAKKSRRRIYETETVETPLAAEQSELFNNRGEKS